MFKHEKQLFHPVGVEKPNPQYAALLQEQLGGANGFEPRLQYDKGGKNVFQYVGAVAQRQSVPQHERYAAVV